MILPRGTVVAVADGETLKLFRNKGTELRLDLVEFEHPAIDSTNPGIRADVPSVSTLPQDVPQIEWRIDRSDDLLEERMHCLIECDSRYPDKPDESPDFAVHHIPSRALAKVTWLSRR